MSEFSENMKQLFLEEKFDRLVAALLAAERWDLHRSASLFNARLLMIGAWQDVDGQWRLRKAHLIARE